MMTAKVRISKTCIEVYQHVLLGISQSDISKLMKKSKSTINGHIDFLLKSEFLEIEKQRRGLVTFYRRGSKANVLDAIINEQTVRSQVDMSGSEKPNATGVRRCSESKDTYFVTTYNAHHSAYKRMILKDGDWQIFKKKSNFGPSTIYYAEIKPTEVQYSNTRKLLGYVPRKDVDHIEVRLYQSIRVDDEGREYETLTLHVHVPHLILTESDVDRYEEIGCEVAKDIYAYFTKKLGWYYCSEVEKTKWEDHIATPAPYFKKYADRATVYSDDRTIYTSYSDNEAEVESKGERALENIREYLNLPADMRSAESRLEYIERNGERILAALERNQSIFLKMAENEGIRLSMDLYRSKQEEQQREQTASDFGGMYQ